MAKYNTGNQLRVGPNTKGTGKRGVPTAIALRVRDYDLGTSSNPDGAVNRPATKVAAKSK